MKKIKRMLAFILKDELAELIEPALTKQSIQFVERTIEFDTIKLDMRIQQHVFDNPREYERALKRAKDEIFIEVEKCIEVDSFPLVSHRYAGERFVRILLRVQKPKLN